MDCCKLCLLTEGPTASFFPLFLILKVRGSSEESYKLDKPHSELMRYDVHPNALTQSGNYHFSGKNKFVMTQPLSGWLCC